MTDYKICCSKCVEEIGRASSTATKLWMELCHIYKPEAPNITLSHDVPELRILENLGYIVSTERGKNIGVRLLGAHCTESNKFFCSRSEHE